MFATTPTILRVAAVAAAVLLGSAAAGAADQALFGKKLLIKNPPSGQAGNKIVHLAKDATVTVGPAGGDGDPQCTGANTGGTSSIQIIASGGAGDVTIPLPCRRWSTNGSNNLYKYRDATGTSCSLVLIREGALAKAVCKGAHVAIDLNGSMSPVTVITTLNADRYCTQFGGTVVKDGSEDKAFLRKDAPTATCPPTTTTTSTPPTTTTTLPPPPYTLRLHAIALADSDGGRAFTFDAEDLTATVQRTNDIFAATQIQFAFDPLEDWEPILNTELNTMDRGGPNWPELPNSIAAQYPGKLVVFFRFGEGSSASGNGNAYPPDIGEPIPPSWVFEPTNVQFVTMPSTQPLIDQNPSFFAHEVGHYLGLYHTFPYTWDGFVLGENPETLSPAEAEERLVTFIRQNGDTLDALDGDLLGDTAPDPGTLFWVRHGHQACSGADTVTLSGTLAGMPYDYALEPPRLNVMSYYACADASFTAQQGERMQATLMHPSRSHLIQ